MVLAEKLFYGKPDKRDRGRREGLASLKPTRLRTHMRVLGVAMIALLAVGMWWGAGAGGPSDLDRLGWLTYEIWLGVTLLGIAAVWTFLAERTVRPALVALAVFGVVSAVLGSLLVW